MIGSVRGTVIERTAAGEVLVEVGGMGYRVNVPLGAVPGLRPGTEAFLFTHLHVREDAMVLYGFPTRDERDTFEALLGANGVGPKLALAILSVHPPAVLRRCLAEDDLASLTLVPGVGKRTAQRLLVELKARLDMPDVDLVAGAAVTAPRGGARRARRAGLLGRRGPGGALRARRRRLRRGPAARRAATAGRGAMRDELLSPTADPVEAGEETTLRPRHLREFVGQARLREHLEIMLAAARGRGQAVDHVLLAGPPGLGKTSLAGIIANEMGARLQPTAGRRWSGAGDLAAILTNLDDGDVLFIDEIHRLPATRRGGPLPGDGGLPARHRDRARGPRRARSRHRPAALHARRRDHPDRADHGPLRDRFGSSPGSTTTRPTTWRDRRARGADPRGRARAARAQRRSRADRAARRASPTGSCAGAGLRRGGRADGRDHRAVARDALACFEVDELGLDKVDRAHPRRAVHERTPAGRRASAPSPSRSARRPRPSRTSTSRSCSSAG
ncbi:MAG: hypothetical protein KatS3mg010_0642 [Acidimicrobiia bacterium]|nr:MAG: hypothetical protein KatS3mg010_0642 [Acidimicrobiia bacterium]